MVHCDTFGESKISNIFLSKNLGSVHYPKGLEKSLWAKSCCTRLRPKSKNIIVGGFYEKSYFIKFACIIFNNIMYELQS